ncbi:helix-turn-helix transcriptional regulator [Sporosarcina aquimarina]|uniref:helix-turn-helix transcriptional regulator n=1 Tax=Sporosarcina aquimarina TaxID=114975 RepID=UPI001C8DBBFE|nr:helix-turn-helix transcriptional regulator [Sporosarcina aquimarina]MBY0221663.1 helix-turn-helix transcriptional regulator [Sporosarcina aquimarina]
MNKFGNKLRELRESKNLSRPQLSKEIGISIGFIGFLEKNERNASNATCKKYAKYFGILLEELLALRDGVEADSIQTKPALPAVLPATVQHKPHIQQMMDFLESVEDETCEKLVTELLQQGNEWLANTLRLFKVDTVAQRVLDYRSKWLAAEPSIHSDHEQTDVLAGTLSLDNPIYLEIQYTTQMMRLTLQTEHQTQSELFEQWMDHYHVSYETKDIIPTDRQEHPTTHFYWFSPIMSPFEKFELLKKLQVDLSNVETYDSQLDWLLQDYGKKDAS